MANKNNEETRSAHDMTIEERVQVFFDAQQVICDNIGLAFAVNHGDPFPLWDAFEGKFANVEPDAVTAISRHDGKTSMRREVRRTAYES